MFDLALSTTGLRKAYGRYRCNGAAIGDTCE